MEREGFLYLDIDHPVVAWNTYRGALMSQPSIARRHGLGVVSMLLAGMLTHGLESRATSRWHSELRIKEVRAAHYPAAVSRLNGLFIFDDEESALAAGEAGWGEHIRHARLTDVGLSYVRSTRADACWITAMLDGDSALRPGWADMAHAYWRSTPRTRNRAVWELLIDGEAMIWGMDLRRQAYEVVRERFPHSLGLLEEARIAVDIGSSLGHISAWVTRTRGGFQLAFYMDDVCTGPANSSASNSCSCT